MKVEKSTKVEHFLSLFKKGIKRKYADSLFRDMSNDDLNQLIEQAVNIVSMSSAYNFVNYINYFKKIELDPGIVKNALKEKSVEELCLFFTDSKFGRRSDGENEFDRLMLKMVDELREEMPKEALEKILFKIIMAVGIKWLKYNVPVENPAEKTNWFQLTDEAKLEIAAEVVTEIEKWYKKLFKNDEMYRIRTKGELTDEVMKYAEIYALERKEAFIKMKQSLQESDADAVEACFSECDLGRYNPNYILFDALDALYEALPADEYGLILEEKISWLQSWRKDRINVICKTRHGLADDRKLFDAVKSVIDEWDPENFWACLCPPDEYDMISGYVAEMLKSTENKDLDSVAWGIHGVMARWFDKWKKQQSVFPELILIAGKLLKAIRDGGIKNISTIKETPYTLQQLDDIEADLEERKTKMADVLLGFAQDSNFKKDDYDEYSNKAYKELQGKYHYLSKDDLDNLLKYCISNARSELWRKRHFGSIKLLDKKIGNSLKEMGAAQ